VSSICFQTVFIFARFLAFYFQLDIKFHQNFHFLFTWDITESGIKGKLILWVFKKVFFNIYFILKTLRMVCTDRRYRRLLNQRTF